MGSGHVLQPGTLLGGRYAIRAFLGGGGIGEVYEAVHTGLSRRVAVKVLRAVYADNPRARARFLREGEAAVRVRHPNAVEVFDFGHEGTTLYLVMEHLAGRDLRSHLREKTSLEATEALELLLPVLAAVAVAHDAGVIHRDLTPANVFLARAGDGTVVPKVLDFGISRVLDDARQHRTETGAQPGTPVYMAPELTASTHDSGPLSDQYALGVMVYECLAGAAPFHGDDGIYPLLLRIAEGAFPPLRSVRPAVSAALEAVVHRAMAREPASRYPSLRAFGAALLPFADPSTAARWRPVFASGAPDPVARVPSRPWPARRYVLLAALPVGITVGLVARGAFAPTSAPESFTVEVHPTPANATVEIDGESGLGAQRREFTRDGWAHYLRVHAAGYEDYTLTFVDAMPSGDIALERRSEPRALGSRPTPPVRDPAPAPAPTSAPTPVPTPVPVPALPVRLPVRASTHARVGPNGMPDLE